MLNTVHHQVLRLALGVCRTSPVESLYVEARELPLEERRIKLALQYITKLKSDPLNPAYDCVFRPLYEQMFDNRSNVIAPLGIRMKYHIVECDLDLYTISDVSLFDIPPWEMSKPYVDLSLNQYKKSETNLLDF